MHHFYRNLPRQHPHHRLPEGHATADFLSTFGVWSPHWRHTGPTLCQRMQFYTDIDHANWANLLYGLWVTTLPLRQKRFLLCSNTVLCVLRSCFASVVWFDTYFVSSLFRVPFRTGYNQRMGMYGNYWTYFTEDKSKSSQVKVTLQLTVSQSVSLGVEPHLELMTRYLVLFDSYGLVFFCGAPSLTRGRVCLYWRQTCFSSYLSYHDSA
jgi:hypothetical protein